MLNRYESPRILSKDWPSYQTANVVGHLASADGARAARYARLTLGDTPLDPPEIYKKIDSCKTLSPEKSRYETVKQFAYGQARWLAYSVRARTQEEERAPRAPAKRAKQVKREARNETVAITLGVLYTLFVLFSGLTFVFGAGIVEALSR